MNNTSPEAISELIDRLEAINFPSEYDEDGKFFEAIDEAIATLQHLSELVQAPLPSEVQVLCNREIPAPIKILETGRINDIGCYESAVIFRSAADMIERLARHQQYLEIPYFLRQPGAVEEDVIKEINKLKARIKELEEL